MASRPEELEVWVLAGQSNMQGCGWLAGSLPPDERVWSFSSAGGWEVAAEPLHRLWESFTPVHQELMRAGMSEADRGVSDEEWARREAATRTCGAGLGVAFGRAMAESLGRPVGLVPAAHGGTTLEQWSPAHRSLGGRSLYGAMLERIERAGGRLRGILWYQGESDASSVETACSYAERFDRWIAAARADTGVPDLPVVAVQIGRVIEPADRTGVWPGWDLVREALGTLPGRVAHTAVTSAVDLPLADSIHVDTAGLARLGRRMARLALSIARGGAGAECGPRVQRIERSTTPAGGRNALRVTFSGVTGRWLRRDAIRGFEVRDPAEEPVPPTFVVNAWTDAAGAGAGQSVTVLLNRDPGERLKLGYGLGINPVCDLVDEADMPLCSLMPRAADR